MAVLVQLCPFRAISKNIAQSAQCSVVMAATRTKNQEIAPETYFAGWAYAIQKCHYASLGVDRREFVDKAATAALREQAALEGKSKTDAAKLKVMRKAWVRADMSDFNEFDLFWSADGRVALQIVRISDMLEVHRVVKGDKSARPRWAYLLTEAQFLRCLETGQLPETARIWAGSSGCDIFRFSIQDPETDEASVR